MRVYTSADLPDSAPSHSRCSRARDWPTTHGCAGKTEWARRVLKARRPQLVASEDRHPVCYGRGGLHGQVGSAATAPFGPWHNPTKWMSKEHAGEPRYTVDLGKDPVVRRPRHKHPHHACCDARPWAWPWRRVRSFTWGPSLRRERSMLHHSLRVASSPRCARSSSSRAAHGVPSSP
jgi:hypothetical protein